MELIDAEMGRITEVIRSSEELAAAAGASGPVYVQLFKGKNLVSTSGSIRASSGLMC